MNKRLFAALVVFLTAGTLCAEKIDMNGDFEKCKPDSNGVILPEGWIINKGISKKSEIQITKEPDEIRNGKFALRIENEKDGTAYIMKWQPVEVGPGDKIQCSVWVKGKGKIALEFITNGVLEGQKNSDFLGSSAWPVKQLNSETTWVETNNTYSVKEIKKDNKVYSKLSVIPIIYVENEAELCLDDYTFELIKAERK